MRSSKLHRFGHLTGAALLLLLLGAARTASAQPASAKSGHADATLGLPGGRGLAWPSAAPRRMAWCDFGAHAQALAGVAMALDPVFRTPPPNARAALEQARAAVRSAVDAGARSRAADKLSTLLQGPDGPALARLGLLDAEPVALAAVLAAARPLVAAHPRVASFATTHASHAAPDVAIGAVHLLLATACDAPALYACDGLRHPDARVQRATLEALALAQRSRLDIGLFARVDAWLDDGAGTPRARAAALRHIGALGWLPSGGAVVRRLRDSDSDVAAEALVTQALLSPTAAEAQTLAWLSDPAPLRRSAAVRAAAAVWSLRPAHGEAKLAPLLADPAVVVDPVSGASLGTVGELARHAVRYLRLR